LQSSVLIVCHFIEMTSLTTSACAHDYARSRTNLQQSRPNRLVWSAGLVDFVAGSFDLDKSINFCWKSLWHSTLSPVCNGLQTWIKPTKTATWPQIAQRLCTTLLQLSQFIVTVNFPTRIFSLLTSSSLSSSSSSSPGANNSVRTTLYGVRFHDPFRMFMKYLHNAAHKIHKILNLPIVK